ncbi:MAG: hypothetical protein RJQ04_20845 [Longimicrobiales bacterium]
MLRLLRSVRRRLMSDSASAAPAHVAPKVRAYLLYALGEIALVVIGILIALQIGEWAQDREREAQVRAILVEVREDLIADARDLADRVVERQFRRDSVRAYVLNGEATRPDYEGRPDGLLHWLPLDVETFEPRQNGWERLQRIEGAFPPRYAELRAVLNELYVDRHGEFRRLEDIAREQALAREQWLVDHTEWAYLFLDWSPSDDPLPDEVIDWFYRGHMHRNWMAQTVETSVRYDELYAITLAAWTAAGGAIGAQVDDPLVPEGFLVDDPSQIEELAGRWVWPNTNNNRHSEISLLSGVLYSDDGWYRSPFFRSGPDSWQPFYLDPSRRSTYRLRTDDTGETVLVREPPPREVDGDTLIFRRDGN